MDNCADEVYNRDNLWYAELGGESGMKDKVYMAIDLSNAEKKEMPILSANIIIKAKLQKISAFLQVNNLNF